MNKQSFIGNDIHHASEILRSGELVAIPTETVYGLAGNALDEDAVLKIFKMKERPSFDPLIVHVGKLEDVELYAKEIPSQAMTLMQQFWPGPLTVLLKKKNIIPDLVTSGLDTVAIRMPDHPMTLRLLNKLDFPLAAPSANPFGYISPTTAQHVADQFAERIPYIVDGGECKVGIESTIIGFEDGNCTVYRLGGMRISEIEKYTGNLNVNINSSSDPRAPGMLKSHYAPSVPLYFGELKMLLMEHENKKAAVICLSKKDHIFPPDFKIIELSPSGNLDEAAHSLFAVMRKLDQPGIDCILAEQMPLDGLGPAINDRLKRASINQYE